MGNEVRGYDGRNIDTRDANKTIRTMEIWMADLPVIEGTSIQAGRRPILVISNDINNSKSKVINYIPITSKVNSKSKLPTHVLLNCKDTCLLKDSMALVEGFSSTSKDFLIKRMGTIENTVYVDKIAKAMCIQCPLLGVLSSMVHTA